MPIARCSRPNAREAGAVPPLAARAAIKDTGRALGVPLARVNQVTEMVPDELKITIKKALEKKASQQKIALRMANPELEALLYKWGSITEPKNPIVLGMRQQLRNQSPTGEADTMDIQKLIEE